MHANDLFATITDQLVADIEAGAGTWRMPWHTLADAGTPLSIEQRPYRGLNALWLPMVAASQGWTSGVWATYRGWQRHDAQVRRDEKGTQVVLWRPTTTKTDADADADDSDEGSGQRAAPPPTRPRLHRVRRRAGRRRREGHRPARPAARRP